MLFHEYNLSRCDLSLLSISLLISIDLHLLFLQSICLCEASYWILKYGLLLLVVGGWCFR